ncbi:MAG: DUF4091 domain-containing protein [Bradymonadales bacterium]|nr:DUF4091 domain-containing protein [Bradymonadales bacterium]
MRTAGLFCALSLSVWLCHVAPAHAENLVVNGGFENGHEGWSGGEVVAQDPHSGSFSLQVIDSSNISSPAAHTTALIPISQGSAYRVEVWFRGETDGQEMLVALNQYDGSGSWISGANLDFLVTAGEGWRQMQRVVIGFHPDATAIRIVLYPVRWTPGGERMGTGWFDDVLFEETEADGTIRGVWLVDEGPVRLWQSPVEQKVSRNGVLPPDADPVDEVHISAARGEVEPFQLVLVMSDDTAEEALVGASVTSLVGPEGEEIDSEAFTIREVAYLEVTHPTDWASTPGWRPDPLPLLELPLALQGSQQQPLWFSLAVPAGIEAGMYQGIIQLEFALAEDLEVPIRLQVWDFDLDLDRHFDTAYGMDLRLIDRYHNLGGDTDKRRQVLRLYLEDFARHRISPYNPLGDDGYQLSFPNFNWTDPDALIIIEPDSVTGNRVLEVADQRDNSNVSVSAELAIPIDRSADYRISWQARIDERLDGDDYLVALNQYDAEGRWIPSYNLDNVRYGTSYWQTESVLIPHTEFSELAHSVRIHLYARRWTENGELTGRTWFDDLVFQPEVRGNNLVVNGDFELLPEDVEIDADFSRFDVAATYAFDELGLDSFRLPLYNFASCSWSSTHRATLLGYPWGTPEYEALFTEVLQIVTGHLEDRGWLELAYAYPFDEPNESQIPLVIEGMSLLHQAEPDLRRLLTKPALDELVGSVDIWVPLISDHDPVWAQERQEAGEEVWWYVCTGPRAPYPNNFIDHPGIEHRIRFWMAFMRGVTGSLYWQTTYWTNDTVFEPPDYQDPWSDPQSYYYYEGQAGKWGNGDGRLVYPPREWADGQERIEGPTPSLRWELLREGIEDYEYFWMLREAAAELEESHLTSRELLDRARRLLQIPETIFTSTTEYTDDPYLLADHRAQVAATLVEILDVLGSGPEGEELEGDEGPTDAGVDVGDAALDYSLDLPLDAGTEIGDPAPDQGVDLLVDIEAEPDDLPWDQTVDRPPDQALDPAIPEEPAEEGGPADLAGPDQPAATTPEEGGCSCSSTGVGFGGWMLGCWAGLLVLRRWRSRAG